MRRMERAVYKRRWDEQWKSRKPSTPHPFPPASRRRGVGRLGREEKWTTAQLKKEQSVRGKLNVSRERFRQGEEGGFTWAGK